MSHEDKVFEGVTQARSKMGQVNIQLAHTAPAEFLKMQQAEAGLTQALSKLMVVRENYPELKANQGFRDLGHRPVRSRGG